MNAYITGAAIRALREKQHLTQSQLAEKLCVSDKTVSKWETGRGLPDITLLEPLAAACGVSLAELLSGAPVSNTNVSANMLRSVFYVCPVCGNILHSTGPAVMSCHGIILPPLEAEDSAAPDIQPVEDEYYEKFIMGTPVKLVKNKTYPLLANSKAALVTSGTATLETALFNVPQVVCYETPVPKLIRFAFNHIIKVKYISLVNLIANKEIVKEMLADRFTVDGIADELYQILPGMPGREKMLAEYQEVRQRLGDQIAPDEASAIMYDLIKKHREEMIRLAKERAEAEAKAAAEAAERARIKAEQEAQKAREKAEREAALARQRAQEEAERARRKAEEQMRIAEEMEQRAREGELPTSSEG